MSIASSVRSSASFTSFLLTVTPSKGLRHSFAGFTSDNSPYKLAVPTVHLRHAAMLKAEFPGLNVFVSDYSVPLPDPFIMCTTHNGWRIVFGVWDEPGFGT